jgi:hypothetical protein
MLFQERVATSFLNQMIIPGNIQILPTDINFQLENENINQSQKTHF